MLSNEVDQSNAGIQTPSQLEGVMGGINNVFNATHESSTEAPQATINPEAAIEAVRQSGHTVGHNREEEAKTMPTFNPNLL